MSEKLIVSGGPHIHSGESVSKVMWFVALSLAPAGAAGIIVFGLPALQTILAGILAAVAAEWLIGYFRGKKSTISDGSAVLTGLLLAYNVPPNAPFWIPAAGAVFAIGIGKLVFGGLGQNIFNPALVGRAFLMASWPAYMTSFARPLTYDAVTGATPLALIREGLAPERLSYFDMFMGNMGGCVGEVCKLALLIGALFLFIRRYISWHIPGTFIASTALLTFIFGPQGLFTGDWLFHVLSGGLILGAFFMATDYVTSPLTTKGKIIFGAGCGVITAVIRLWGGYPEGVSYAILLMNAATPLIDRYSKTRGYGVRVKTAHSS